MITVNEEVILKKIDEYKPKGSLGNTSKFVLNLFSFKHRSVKRHVAAVALLSELTAQKLEKDSKAAFFGGLLHDIGKITLPYNLFDGHNITSEEYGEVKKHAFAGFEALKESHLFTAYCAGLHHVLYQKGYGIKLEDFPKEWSLSTIKKVLEISTIISVCDFIDAFTSRKTKIKDGSGKNSSDLKEMLMEKYPDDKQLIKTALEAFEELKK